MIRIDMIEGRTEEQKRKIVEEITDTMVRVANAKPKDVHVIFYEHSLGNLGATGRLLSDDPSMKRP
jgi:4-oxalocrotonate tautomerase